MIELTCYRRGCHRPATHRIQSGPPEADNNNPDGIIYWAAVTCLKHATKAMDKAIRIGPNPTLERLETQPAQQTIPEV